MKRSEINQAIEHMIGFADGLHFKLPPFGHFTPGDWQTCGAAYDEIRRAGLGWDVTDFGKGDFAKCGLTLFTVRNGVLNDADSKTYCEKIMLVLEEQLTPMHFHWKKTEDIINRGGGNLICQVHRANNEERLGSDEVVVSMDGCEKHVPAGSKLVLKPGESVTLTPYVYHAFWGEPGKGPVLVGEVSTVNDDANDNRFLDELPRYPGIEEDAAPVRLLCTEYPAAK
ncbi:MAG: D-lyxose/D-mannose family sugar isomerase [Phycisphaerales bacterium]|nr:D-lyxose/D-mannose family sugar isomerase [Phycisphaerales bacterium]